MASFPSMSGTGSGSGGLVYPDSAARPFASNSARNTWANNNKIDLVKDTTVVNVGGNQWYLWVGESNPSTVNTSLWMDASEIVQGEKGDTGAKGTDGVDVTNATINTSGDLIITLSNGSTINTGKAKGEDGDLVYQVLPMADYGNFFDADWGTLGTNIYGVTGLGSQFANTPFPLNASTTYSFECLLVNEPNQYSLRVTAMSNADFGNSGRDAILAGTTKTAAESIGWKVYAFTQDAGHTDPTEGFDLQPNADIGLDSTSAVTIKNNAGDVHNAIDQDINLDAIRLGSPAMKTYLRTNEDRMQVQTTNGMKDLAHMDDLPEQTNPDRFTYWLREATYTLSADEIGKEVLLAVQPMVETNGVKETTITFPSQTVFTNHYYIPDVSPASDATIKPHIETFRFSIWAYYFQSHPVKITLKSDGDWLPFVSSESLSENGGVYLYRESEKDTNELHTFAFMRPLNHNPTVGLQGWSFQNVHPYSWLPLTSQPPASPPISTLGTFMVDDDESSHLRTGTGLTSTYDPATGDHTLESHVMSVDGEIPTQLNMGAGITADHDPATGITALSVDPTNVDLSGYAELDKDVSFAEVTAKKLIIDPERDPTNSTSSLQIHDGNGQVMLGSVIKEEGSADPDFVAYLGNTDQSGSIQNLESTIAKFSEGRTYGFGTGSILSVSQNVINDRRRYIIGATAPDAMTLTISDDLEGCRLLIESIGSESINFTTITIAVTGRPNLVFEVGKNDKWIVETNRGADSNAYRVKNGAETTAIGLAGRNLEVNEASVRPFQYVEGMPYHLLLETPTSSRLVHEFPKNKTHQFTPIDSNRRYEGVTINSSNEAAPSTLGEYSDIPLYIFEPNQVINRDQVGYINFPADITINVNQGFYSFGTVSGWAGGAQNNGTMAVYVGVDGDNPKAGNSKIGFALISDRLVILTGNGSQDAVSATASKFNLTNGVANFYRFAFYVDNTGMMTYYIVSLNTRVLHSGQQQCDLTTVTNNPKLWVAYDREGSNTSSVAVGEIHLVTNYEGEAEQMWNWRN